MAGIELGEDENELLTSYAREYDLVYSDASQKIELLDTAASTERRKLADEAEHAIDEAYELIDQMAVEVQSLPSSSRPSYNARLRGFRSDVDRARRTLRKHMEGADRRALFGGRSAAGMPGDVGAEQRQSLLFSQQSIERSSDRLRESQRVANETESIGASILTDLRGQREQIVNSRNTLFEADGNVERSLRTLRGMARRLAANKVITWAIIAILVLLIVFVIFSKFW